MSLQLETRIGESLRTARELSGIAGLELMQTDVLRLVVSGLLVLSHEPGGPAVGVVRPGETEGLQRAAGLSDGLRARVLNDAVWREMPIAALPPSATYAVTMEAAEDACTRLDAAAMELSCALHHPIEQRLARWLGVIDDALGGTSIRLTQVAFAAMLGAQRTTINGAIMKLKAAQVIRSTRNNLVVDRHGLKAFACLCRVERKSAQTSPSEVRSPL